MRKSLLLIVFFLVCMASKAQMNLAIDTTIFISESCKNAKDGKTLVVLRFNPNTVKTIKYIKVTAEGTPESVEHIINAAQRKDSILFDKLYGDQAGINIFVAAITPPNPAPIVISVVIDSGYNVQEPQVGVGVLNQNNTICEGAALRLLAQGESGSGYLWTGPNGFTSTTQNPIINNAQAINIGAYSVVATHVGNHGITCYSDTVKITPTITDVPNPDFTIPIGVCQSSPLPLQVTTPTSGVDSYLWKTPNGSPTTNTTQGPFNVTYSTATATASPNNITLVVTKSGCKDSVVKQIQVKAIPTATLSALSNKICNGATGTLRITFAPTNSTAGPFFFTYDANGTVISDSSNKSTKDITISITTQTTYKLLSVNNFGCPGTVGATPVVVDVNPPLVATIDPIPATVCQNSASFALTGQPSGGAFTIGSGVTGTVATGFVFTPLNSGGAGDKTIIYTYTDANGCSATATKSVKVFGRTTLTLTGPNSVCRNGSPVNLSNSLAGGVYTVEGGGGGLAANPTTNNVFTPSATTINPTVVYYIYTAPNGCIDSAKKSINIIAIPSVGIIVPPPFTSTLCFGNSSSVRITFNGSAPYVYTYNNGTTTIGPITTNNASTNIPVTQPNSTVTYTLLSGSASGCTATIAIPSTKITVNPLPTITFNNIVPNPVCPAAPLVDLVATPTGGTFSTTPLVAVTGTKFDPSKAGFTGTSVTRTVTYDYTDPATNCKNSATQNITIVPPPTATYNVASTTVCPGTPLQVTYTGNATTAGTYNWDFKGSTATGQGPHFPQWPAPDTTTKRIKLTVTDFGCTATDSSKTVKIKQAPTVTIAATPGVCQGTNATVTFTFTGTGPWNLVYNDNGTDITRNNINSNPFILTVPMPTIGNRVFTIKSISDAGGCLGTFGTSTATVAVVAKPNSSFTPNPASICVNGTSTFNYPSPSATATYTWKFTQGTPATATGAGTHTITWASTGSKSVTLVINESSGCIDSTTRLVMVNPLPIATISKDSTICTGTAAWVRVNFTAGTPPYRATLRDQLGNTFPVGPTNNTSVLVPLGPSITTSRDVSIVNGSVTDNNNCVGLNSTAEVRIRKKDLPTATLSVIGATTICATDSASLQVNFSGTAPYTFTYQSTPGVSVTRTTNLNPFNFKVKPASNTSYHITSVSDSSCINTASGTPVAITVIQVPTATFSVNPASLIGCVNAPITVTHTGTATASATYAWAFPAGTPTSATGKGPNAVTYGPAATGAQVITLTVTDGVCAPVSANRTVTINALPSATIAGNQTICQSGTAVVNLTFPTGAAPFSIVYSNSLSGVNGTATGLSNPGTTSVLMPTVGTATLALVSVSDANGCTSTNVSGSAVINVVTRPSSNFALNPGVCLNNPTTITYSGTASATATYTWDFGGGTPATGTGTADQVVSWASLGSKNVRLIANESGGCADTTIKAILVGNPPTATISNDTTVCLGNQGRVKLTFTGAATYKATIRDMESGATYPVTTSAAVSYVDVTVTDSTTFEIVPGSVSDGNCAGVGSGTVKVNVNPMPTAKISGSDVLCIGDSATLKIDFTGIAPFNYSYQLSTGGSVSGVTNNNSISFKVGPTVTTTYKLLSASDKFCIATLSDSALVRIVQKPILDFTVAPGCINTALDVTFTGTASPLADYTWSFGADGTPTGATGMGVHQVTYNSEGSKLIELVLQDEDKACPAASLTKTIIIHPLPMANMVGGASICQGDSTSLNFTFTAGTAPWTFTYNNGTTDVVVTAPASPFVIKVAPATTTTYKLVSVTDANLCVNATGLGTVALVTVSTKPNSNFTIDSLKMCQNDSVLVKYSGGVSATATYNWDFNGGTAQSLGNETYKVFWPTGGVKTVSLSVNESAGCLSDTTRHNITVNVLPLVNIGIDTITICAGDAATIPFTLVSGTAPYNVTLFNTEGGIYSYNFKGVFSPQPIIFNDSTIVQIQAGSVRDANGCIGSGTGKITINAKPLATAEISDDTQICAGQSATLTIHFTGIAPYTYIYNDGTKDVPGTSPLLDSVNIIVSPTTTTTYKMVSVTDALCAGVVSDSVAVVTVIPLPIASIDLPAAACENLDVDVRFNGTPSASATYNWNFGTGATTPAGNGLAAYKIQWASFGTKYVSLTVTDQGCTSANTAMDSILVKDKPTGSVVSPDDTVCQRSSANLSFNFVGLAPYKYRYSDGVTTSAEITTNNATETISVLPTILPQTVYKLVSLTDLACAANTLTDSTVVTVTAAPTAAFVVNPDTVCGRDTLHVAYTGTNFGAATFNWHGFDGATVVNTLPSEEYDITYATFGSKFVKLTIAENGCSDSTTVPLFINDAPKATIDSDTSICSGAGARLRITFSNGNPTFTYTVSGFAQTFTTDSSVIHLDVAPTATTTYKVLTLKDITGCEAAFATDSAKVTVNKAPTFDFDAKPKVCKNEDAEVYVTYMSGTSPWTASVFVSNPATTVTHTSTAAQDTVRFPITQDVTVSVSIKDSNTCTATSTKTLPIGIVPIPSTLVDAIRDTACAGIDVIVDGLLSDPSYTYKLTSPTDPLAVITDDGFGSFMVSWKNTGTQQVAFTVFDGVCSSDTAFDQVFINPSPEVSITTDKNVFCAEDVVDVKIHLKGIKAFNFDLDVNGSTQNVSNHNDTLYTLQQTLMNKTVIIVSNLSDKICSSDAGDDLTLNVNPKPEIVLNLDPVYCIDKTLVNIKDAASQNVKYDFSLLPAAGFKDNADGTAEFYPNKAGVGSYTFVANFTNTFNCVDVETVVLTVEEPQDPTFDVPSDLCNNIDTIPVTFFGGGSFIGYTIDKSGLAYDPVTGYLLPSASTVGTYLLSYNNNLACTVPADIHTVHVIKGPDAPVVANLKDTIICRQTHLSNRYHVFNAQAGVSYEWKLQKGIASGAIKTIPAISTIMDTIEVAWVNKGTFVDTLKVVGKSSSCSSDSAIYPIYTDSVATRIYTVSDSTLADSLIQLHYTASASFPQKDTVVIERRSDLLSPWAPVGIAHVVGDTVASDFPTPKTFETSWYYRTGVRNYCGAIVYGDSARTMLLGGQLLDESTGLVRINFNDYEGWPALGKNDKYEIWRKLGDQDTFELFSHYDKIVSDTGFAYTDIMQDDRNQCFRVKAIYDTLDASKPQVPSYSNIFCFKFPNIPKIYNVFSPNGDGKNEYFYVENIRSYQTNELYILNRWGNKVYHRKDYNNDWDGDGLPAGTYFYLFKVQDPELNKTYEFKGNVLIVR